MRKEKGREEEALVFRGGGGRKGKRKRKDGGIQKRDLTNYHVRLAKGEEKLGEEARAKPKENPGLPTYLGVGRKTSKGRALGEKSASKRAWRTMEVIHLAQE